nr:anaerobic dehydrogenase [uncultured bacterium]
MYWRYGGSFFGTMTQTNRYVKAYRNPKLEFAVSQPIWWEGEAKFADIVLPACTNFERWDISEFASCSGYIPHVYTQTNNRVISLQMKCIEPLGESKSDYDIFAAVCERLGIGDLFTMGGKDEYEWVKEYFEATDLPKLISWKDFEKKGYVVVPFPEDHKSTPALRWFAEDRVRDTPDWAIPSDTVGLKGLQTASGKIEFVSSSLARFEAGGNIDPERPIMARSSSPAGGTPQRRSLWQVSAADGFPPPPLQLPHHG